MLHEADYLIVGAGPAGLSTALHLLRASAGSVMLIDAGSHISRRVCPVHRGFVCPPCRSCGILSGVGGASGMQGGKLCFFPAGVRMLSHLGRTTVEANLQIVNLLSEVAPALASQVGLRWITGVGESELANRLALKKYFSAPVLQAQMIELFTSLFCNVEELGGKVLDRTRLVGISSGDETSGYTVEILRDREQKSVIVKRAVVLALGRNTPSKTADLLHRSGVAYSSGAVDVGIRLEGPSSVYSPFLSELEDPKLKLRIADDREVRTLCWCRGGEMSVTNMDGLTLVDGHFGTKVADLTSVSIVVRLPSEDDDDAFRFAREHVLQDRTRPPGVTLARAFQEGRSCGRLQRSPTIPAVEEQLWRSYETRVVDGTREMLNALLEDLGPTMLDTEHLVYGPVVDYSWPKPLLQPQSLRSRTAPGIYIAGDLTGLGRGIVQGLYSGVVAAEELAGQVSGDRLNLEAWKTSERMAIA